MSSDIIQAKYDELETIARQFGDRAQRIGELRSQLQRSAQPLEQGGWQGVGSAAFFREMSGQIYPATQRLRLALEEARAVTLQASEIMRRAEQEASALFRGAAEAGANGASGAAGFAGATASAAGGRGSGGFLSGVGDFFSGMWDETKDMVSGIKNLVLHPIDTAKGLAHAIMNPGEFWEGFKKPYVEAWESGHPWQAVGRGTMFALSFVLGAKGADKAAKAGAVAGKAGRAGEVAATAGRAGEVAGTVGRAGFLSRTLRQLGAVGKSRGIASEIVQGLTTRREASFLRQQLKELAGTDIVYGSIKSRGRNFFDSLDNKIHLRSGARQQPRGMFFEEIQHALDQRVANGALNDLRRFGFSENPVLANLRLHAGTFRRMAENPLFKLSPGERANLLQQAIKWENL